MSEQTKNPFEDEQHQFNGHAVDAVAKIRDAHCELEVEVNGMRTDMVAKCQELENDLLQTRILAIVALCGVLVICYRYLKSDGEIPLPLKK